MAAPLVLTRYFVLGHAGLLLFVRACADWAWVVVEGVVEVVVALGDGVTGSRVIEKLEAAVLGLGCAAEVACGVGKAATAFFPEAGVVRAFEGAEGGIEGRAVRGVDAVHPRMRVRWVRDVPLAAVVA